MKEAIEQVIAELERCKVIDEKIDDWNHGWNSSLKMTLLKLKAVLANGENDSSGIPGTDGQAQEQNEKRDHEG